MTTDTTARASEQPDGTVESRQPGVESPAGRPKTRVWPFLILTCLLSWPLWMVSGVLSRGQQVVYDSRWLLAQVGVFGPSLAALIVSGAGRKELRQNSLRMLPVLVLPLFVPGIAVARSSPTKVAEFPLLPSAMAVVVAAVVILFFLPTNLRLLNPATGETYGKPGARWVALSVAIFPALFLAAWLLVSLPGGIGMPSSLRQGGWGFAWAAVVAFSHNLLLGGPLGEEIGWRGFMLPELLRRHSPLAASLILGVTWGLWHAPIDLSAGLLVNGAGAVLVRIVWSLPVTIVFTWFYIRSKGSLLVALFLHASLNALPDLGFPNYEPSLMLLLVILAVLAIVIGVGGGFRSPEPIVTSS